MEGVFCSSVSSSYIYINIYTHTHPYIHTYCPIIVLSISDLRGNLFIETLNTNCNRKNQVFSLKVINDSSLNNRSRLCSCRRLKGPRSKPTPSSNLSRGVSSNGDLSRLCCHSHCLFRFWHLLILSSTIKIGTNENLMLI